MSDSFRRERNNLRTTTHHNNFVPINRQYLYYEFDVFSHRISRISTHCFPHVWEQPKRIKRSLFLSGTCDEHVFWSILNFDLYPLVLFTEDISILYTHNVSIHFKIFHHQSRIIRAAVYTIGVRRARSVFMVLDDNDKWSRRDTRNKQLRDSKRLYNNNIRKYNRRTRIWYYVVCHNAFCLYHFESLNVVFHSSGAHMVCACARLNRKIGIRM